jgi:sterol 3beta-glucosyltransferase
VSSVKEVKPVDWEHPRTIGIVYEYSEGLVEGNVEFDTIEAARDWRNELRGVDTFFFLFNLLMDEFPVIGLMFLYRRNRRAVLDPTEDVNGIRLNIPLSRIATVSKSHCLSFAWMVSITIGAGNLASNGTAVTPPAEIDSLSDNTLSEVLSQDSETEPYVVQFAAIRKDPVWEEFTSYVEKAKAAMAADATEWAGSNVYIDFDPRADLEDEGSEGNGLNGLQKSVSHALGLDPTKEFYSEWICPSKTWI